MSKRAIVTGLLGQDASYLAEYLIELGYDVYGLYRRVSSGNNLSNINAIEGHKRLHAVAGDIRDHCFMSSFIAEIKPDEFYNLAANSHVGHSFDLPVETMDIDATPVMGMLDSIRKHSPATRFYQASTSELFGGYNCPLEGFDETSQMNPQSPYAVAKLAAFHATKMYRNRKNGIFACSGILFNHSVHKETPILVREKGFVNICPIQDLRKLRDSKTRESWNTENDEIEVWSTNGWTKVKEVLAHRIKPGSKLYRIRARAGVVSITDGHSVIMADGSEKKGSEVKAGDRVSIVNLPADAGPGSPLSPDTAWLLGITVAEGFINEESGSVQISNTNPEILDRVKSTGAAFFQHRPSSYTDPISDVVCLTFHNSLMGRWLRSELYTKYSRKQRVPQIILNANAETMAAFLEGFNAGDGRKWHKYAYEFQAFSTWSPTLALGIQYLVKCVTGQDFVVDWEDRETSKGERRTYYQTQFRCPPGSKPGAKGDHLLKALDEVTCVDEEDYNDAVYDLSTEDERFHGGVGRILLHNSSSRRPPDFATRKITQGVARIVAGKRKKIQMGNMEAARDEGSAKEYVRVMHKMLQQDKPDDYVICTQRAATIWQMLEFCCDLVGLKAEDVYERDERFMRPSDVPYLCGNPAKAKRELGWEPTKFWRDVLQEMLEFDLEKETGKRSFLVAAVPSTKSGL